MTHETHESSKDRLILATLISASIHIYFFIPDKYYQVSNRKISKNLQVQLVENNIDTTDTNKIEKTNINSNYTDARLHKNTPEDILKNIYVPEEITDSPAKIRVPFFMESVSNIEGQVKKLLYIKVKLWVNRFGKIDKLEMIESNADEATLEGMLNKIKMAQFEPAVFKGNKVNSVIIGRIEVEY